MVTFWERINIGLPSLPYDKEDLKKLDKSTKWASHSHCPLKVSKWDEFDACIATAALQPSSAVAIDTDLSQQMSSVKLKMVLQEDHVTHNVERILELVADLTGFEFSTTDKYTKSNPELIAWRGLGPVQPSNYTGTPEPALKNREQQRKDLVQERSQQVLFTIETKPAWKFRFLLRDDSTDILTNEWEVPTDYSSEDLYNKRDLPDDWSDQKQKVFHLIRQVYGQMTSSERKYGIMHLYEVWWFCSRTEQGELRISRPFKKESTSPSVLQAIVTLAGFDDFALQTVAVHPQSAQKADKTVAGQRKIDLVAAKKSAASDKEKAANSRKRALQPKTAPSNQGHRTNLASSIMMWNCTLVDATDTVQLLTLKENPVVPVLIKMQRHETEQHVADEMKHEASIYRALCERNDLQEVIPDFLGYSTHLGVSLLCTELEGSNFEDIGLENISQELKQSAVDCMKRLSAAGVLHNDIALRNIVQSRVDPRRAKIIDFGRATFSNDDQVRLQQQVHTLERLLGLRS
jgi:predicted Ser/Thr protein kinase